MKSERIRIINRAEEAIMRFSDNTPLWIKDKTGQEADPWQIVEMEEIEANPNVLVVWPPRFGKTWGMEAVCLKEICIHPGEHEMIFGPKREQADNALREQTDWIEMSEILNAYVAIKRGKRQISETRFQLWNRSQAKTFGMKSHFDSEEASIIRGEEWDDIDYNAWVQRVIARGGRKNKSGLPTRYRLSGTIQEGKGNMFRTERDPDFHVITKFDVYDGIEFDIYDENAIKRARAEMTDDEWLRIYCLIYTEAKNFIWESYLRACLKHALEIGWEGVEYRSGGQYHPHGTVYAGFDCGHSGEKKIHSVYRFDVIEMIGDTALWLNAKEWDSVTDPTLIKNEIRDWWNFYGIHSAYGDALKANMISELNDDLFDHGLIRFDRSEAPENKPSDWDKLAFAPKWNSGKNKYLWGLITKGKIEGLKLVIPYFDDKDDREIAKMAMRLRRGLLNVRMVTNNSSYPTLEVIKPEIGDDPFDAINMANACANDRMEIPINLDDVKTTGQRTVTSGLRATVVKQLHNVGAEADFRDF